MPPGTNVLLRKQQLSDKIAFWFCDLLFREWIWMLLCWRSRWLWSKLLSGRLEVESSFAHSSCLESHNALFSIFGRRCVRSYQIRLTSTSAADKAYLTYRCCQEKRVISSMFINTTSTCNANRVRKTPSACQQCWPESFCKSRKFLRQVHYWLKNFRILCNTKYPDNMQSVRMNWKVSGQSKKCLDNLENVSG